MRKLAVLQTFLSRILIVVLNFGLVIFTTNFWGSEGKGVISMLIADLAIISFVSSIFVGSSVTFFTSRFPKEKVVLFAYVWSVLVGITVPFLLNFSLGHNTQFLPYLAVLSVVSALLSTNINLFVGMQNIKMYNLYSILQLITHIIFIAVLVYILKLVSVSSYFIAQIAVLVLLFAVSSFQLLKNLHWSNFSLSKEIGKEMFRYGWNTQFSAFFQFLNYRLSYYFLEQFKGLASVGVFSVGVAISEAIWTLSRSLSLVLYSEAVNSTDSDFLVQRTKVSLKVSFMITLVFIGVILLTPASVYTLIFGKDFSETKEIILLLSPGILAIATSNIIGHYFAGINKLRILNVKSLVGVVFTILLSIYFVPNMGIAGACIVTTISYLVSSLILFYEFYQRTPFHIEDFFFNKSEIRQIFNQFRKMLSL